MFKIPAKNLMKFYPTAARILQSFVHSCMLPRIFAVLNIPLLCPTFGNGHTLDVSVDNTHFNEFNSARVLMSFCRMMF